MSNEINPIALPDAFLIALGRITVNWSQLEGILDFVLIKLLGASVHDGRYHVPFSQMSFQAKMDCLQSITALLDQKAENKGAHARFKSVMLPKLKELHALRNSITHCKWTIQGQIITRSRLSAKGKFKITQHRINISELEKMAEDILKLSGDLWYMVDFPEFNYVYPAERAEPK